jgi:hypothetical protein
MDAKPRCRSFRFSLRTWLVAVTALCLWLGWWTQSGLRQKHAVELLKSKGVSVVYDVEYVETIPGRLTPMRLKPAGWLETQLGIDYFHNVAVVSRFYGRSSATKQEVLASIRHFPRLKWLQLLVELSDDDLAKIGTRHDLESLMIVGPGISAKGLRQLRALPKLRLLELQLNEITRDVADEISHLGALTRLSLLSVTLEADALAPLSTMNGLCHLAISPTVAMTDDQIASVARMSQLQELTLERCDELSDDSYERLAAMPRLQKLILSRVHLNPSSIEALASMHGLRQLQLWNLVDGVPVNLKSLRQALPNCEIDSNLDLE